MKITIERLNDAVHMEAKNEDGATLQMDGSANIGGINGGFRPMQMLLAAAGGCSAIDIIGILTKQKQNPLGMTIEVEGERVQRETYSEYTAIHMHYIFRSKMKMEPPFRWMVQPILAELMVVSGRCRCCWPQQGAVLQSTSSVF